MLLPDLRREVLEANLELVRKGLVLFTFGNASGISRKKGLVVIKPSGVPYERMKPAAKNACIVAKRAILSELVGVECLWPWCAAV